MSVFPQDLDPLDETFGQYYQISFMAFEVAVLSYVISRDSLAYHSRRVKHAFLETHLLGYYNYNHLLRIATSVNKREFPLNLIVNIKDLKFEVFPSNILFIRHNRTYGPYRRSSHASLKNYYLSMISASMIKYRMGYKS